MQDRLLDRVDVVVVQGQLRVGAVLGLHVGIAQRVLLAAALVLELGLQDGPVGERDAHAAGEGLAERGVVLGLVGDLVGELEDLGLPDRVADEGHDVDLAAHEVGGHGVRDAELRVVLAARVVLGGQRLEDDRHHVGRGDGHDGGDVVDVEPAARGRLDRGVQRCVHEVAGRVGLVGDLRRLPALAEVGELALDVEVVAAQVGVVEAEAPLDDRLGPGLAVGGEGRGQQAGTGGEARVQALGRGAVGEMLEDPGGQAAGDAQGLGRRRGVEAADARGGGGGAVDAEHAGGVEADLVEERSGGQAEAQHDLVAGDEGGEEVGARGAVGLGGGQGGGHDGDADVGDGARVRVVEVQRVAGGAVGEGGVEARQAVAGAEGRGRARGAGLEHRLARPGGHPEGAAGQAAAQRVEEVQLGGLRDLGRQRVGGEGGGERGKAFGDSAHGSSQTFRSVSMPGTGRRARAPPVGSLALIGLCKEVICPTSPRVNRRIRGSEGRFGAAGRVLLLDIV
nr:hypothetical protein [Baekduia soli]